MNETVGGAHPADDIALSPVPAGAVSLFLDFDGTLAEIAPRPDAVQVAPALRTLITALADRLDGRLAIISGRAIAEIDAFIGHSRLATSGSHGLEMRWPDGRVTAPVRNPALDAMRGELSALTARYQGVLIEEKPFGFGIHYRQAPEATDVARALAMRMAQAAGLEVQHGKMVVEIRPPGRHKGDAIREYMTADGIFSAGVPWFVGDDVTDEDGFATVAELGGSGVLVGALRSTAARYRLLDVDAVHGWLTNLLEKN